MSSNAVRKHARIVGCLIAFLPLALPVAQGFSVDSTEVASGPEFQRARLDLTKYVDLTETIPIDEIPLHVPAPAQAQLIGPGSHLLIQMAGGLFGCTANYVWSAGGTYYLGAAGHCFLPEGTTATHGPGADYDPDDTSVSVCITGCSFGGETGFFLTGTLVDLGAVAYARQTAGGLDIGNDFGIVTVPAALEDDLRTAMPVWGGPTTTETLETGEVVCHYGNGVVFGEVWPTMARAGVGVDSNTASWLADSPASLGDSGSAVNVCVPEGTSGVHGRGAVGILTHLTADLGIVAGTTVARAITLTSANAGISLTLETA